MELKHNFKATVRDGGNNNSVITIPKKLVNAGIITNGDEIEFNFLDVKLSPRQKETYKHLIEMYENNGLPLNYDEKIKVFEIVNENISRGKR